MESREQRIRAFLYSLSLLAFFAGLPFILSFALGYKFNQRTFRFTKAGLIVLKTQPQGASIYFENKLWNEKTPATINELLPGQYEIRLELKNHYPWVGKAQVDAGKVAELDKVILFPLRPNIKQLNKDKISGFWVDKDRGYVYYLYEGQNIIYRSNLEGEDFKELIALPEDFSPAKDLKASHDREKILLFNHRQIAIVYLEPQKTKGVLDQPLILDYPELRITDVYWHSDSYHLILITPRDVEAIEARPESKPINLVNLNKKNITSFYDDDRDVLYFIDSQKAVDARFYDNVYKLDLSSKSTPFRELIRPAPNE